MKTLTYNTSQKMLLTTALMLMTTILFGQARETLNPDLVPKFQNDMPVIRDLGLRVDFTQGVKASVQIVETQQDLLGLGTQTKVWAYQFPGLQPTYPGATIVAQENNRINIRWENKLPAVYNNFPNTHLLPVDPNIHIAMPKMSSGVPVVTHLHGGHTESASDGLPEAWFTRDFRETGRDFIKRDYRYDNDQEAATLWYHDHALGVTRLNVYAGLAGFYLLRDANENRLISNNVLPQSTYEIEVVIQDRMFDTNHQLYFPAYPGDPSYDDFIFGEGATPPDGPSALAEFFGDILLVNGKAWPKLEVEPRKYRFRLLNGSDSRFYVLSLKEEIPWFQIGTDNGFLTKATEIGNPIESEAGGELIIAPGERMDLILDFTGKENQEFILWNYGPDEPFGGDVDLDLSRPTAQIMKFVVSKSLNQEFIEAIVAVGTQLRKSSLPELPSNYVSAKQNLVLFEATDQYGRLKPLLGTLSQGSKDWDEPITENPQLNETQVWEIFNATMDAHPIHLHMVSFQVLGRGTYLGAVESIPDGEMTHEANMGMGGSKLKLNLQSRGEWRGPEPNELGWKDTHIVYPGEFSQVRATFDRKGLYVWHCHILSHEDHEMMRPFYVGQMPIGMQMPKKEIMVQVTPNPFNSSTSILFTTENNDLLNLVVYNDKGVKCYQHTGYYKTGQHAMLWDGRDLNGNLLPEGLYYYELSGTDFKTNNRLVIKR